MKPSTRSELLKKPPAEPTSLGERVWKPTSQLKTPSPIVGYSGRNRELVYWMRGDLCLMRPYVVPRDPKTAYQVSRREAMGGARAFWREVDPAEREAWGRYACEHQFPDGGYSLEQGGYLGYVQAMTYHVGRGLPPARTAPQTPPPGRLERLEEVPPPDSRSFAFQIFHSEDPEHELFVLFELTAAMPTLDRKPRRSDFKWAGESDEGSFVPLGPSGAVYLLSEPRVEVEAGKSYGVRARLISPDGVPGPLLQELLVRKSPEAI